ncbi:hypothetical protein COLO4_21892 [Corchorus olitorius]|uniref:Uncharacterized protein n=1 Tax=Corchorus olitorius TaxID=93759 RepID=A0A1R3IQ41_9ROSI|nr:hypothetical protein COLO4_21892 [Corchorus olitorius]
MEKRKGIKRTFERICLGGREKEKRKMVISYGLWVVLRNARAVRHEVVAAAVVQGTRSSNHLRENDFQLSEIRKPRICQRVLWAINYWAIWASGAN